VTTKASDVSLEEIKETPSIDEIARPLDSQEWAYWGKLTMNTTRKRWLDKLKCDYEVKKDCSSDDPNLASFSSNEIGEGENYSYLNQESLLKKECLQISKALQNIRRFGDPLEEALYRLSERREVLPSWLKPTDELQTALKDAPAVTHVMWSWKTWYRGGPRVFRAATPSSLPDPSIGSGWATTKDPSSKKGIGLFEWAEAVEEIIRELWESDSLSSWLRRQEEGWEDSTESQRRFGVPITRC
jgi:hypothetical protein